MPWRGHHGHRACRGEPIPILGLALVGTGWNWNWSES
ncbi:unnamed protein product, partial [Rotaria sp. Silwood1]